MRKGFNNKVILIMLIFIVVIVFLLPFQTALVFYEEKTNSIAAYLPIQVEETFQIIFTHSIHLTDVVEKYKVLQDHTIQEYEFVFEQFGIGMPSDAGEGERFVVKDGKYHIKDMNLTFPSMNIRNGKVVSEHRLVWGKEDEHLVYFNEYFDPGAWFTVKIDKLSLWQKMRGVKIND